jgi:hypothetical protein
LQEKHRMQIQKLILLLKKKTFIHVIDMKYLN